MTDPNAMAVEKASALAQYDARKRKRPKSSKRGGWNPARRFAVGAARQLTTTRENSSSARPARSTEYHLMICQDFRIVALKFDS